MGRRILITGCTGYLAQTLIQACRGDQNIEWLGGIDVRQPQDAGGLNFTEMDVRSPDLARLLKEQKIDTVVHLAWVFNPTHQPELEYEIDVNGSRNVLASMERAGVPYLIYLSSTTSYGPHPDNPVIFDENYPRRGHSHYLYSKYKAEVDHVMLDFIEKHPDIRVFLVRAPIVLGAHTRNVVTSMIDIPVLFGVTGFNPPMQFIHEEDVQRLLLWCIHEQPVGVFNISGRGTISYSEIMRAVRKPSAWLPAWLLYPIVQLLWTFRLMPFPSSILDFIRYPWVADTRKFDTQYAFPLQHSSREALMAYIASRRPATTS